MIVSEVLKRLGVEQSGAVRYGEKWERLGSLDAESNGIMINERNQKE